MHRILIVAASLLSIAPALADPVPRWTFSVEGSAFWDNRNDVGFVGAFGTNSQAGPQGAVSFDYRFDSLWHASAQFRYMKSTSSSGQLGDVQLNPLPSLCAGGPAAACQIAVGAASLDATQRSFVYDAAIGRDVALPFGIAQAKFGFRFADIRMSSSLNGVSGAWGAAIGPGGGIAIANATTGGAAGAAAVTGSGSAFAGFLVGATSFQQIVQFAGVGPRIAVEGESGLAGNWSLDYSAGTAVLFGERKSSLSTNVPVGAAVGPAPTQFGNNLSATRGIFNVDGSAGLSYRFSSALKATVGYRVDAYFDALQVGNALGSNAHFIDHGAFGRLTTNF